MSASLLYSWKYVLDYMVDSLISDHRLCLSEIGNDFSKQVYVLLYHGAWTDQKVLPLSNYNILLVGS